MPECAELNDYRLQKDWTFEQLSAAMARYDINLGPRTLHYIVKRDDHKPLDRTLFKIRRFLTEEAAAEQRRVARARARKRNRKPRPAVLDGNPS